MHTLVRTSFLGLVAVSCLVLLPLSRPTRANPEKTDRTVYLAGELSDEALISLGAAVAARPGALLLLDTPEPSLRRFLIDYRADRIVPVGRFAEGHAGLIRRLGVVAEPIVAWPKPLRVCPLWRIERLGCNRIVVAPRSPRRALLRAAWIAASEGVPLWVGDEDERFHAFLREQRIGTVVRGLSAKPEAQAEGVTTAVVTNPYDTSAEAGRLSALAPWLAASKRATLLFTNKAGDNAATVVERANKPHPRLDTLILLANHKAIPVWQRPNPIPEDRDKSIELEPLAPRGKEPFSYAIGRLFHDDRAIVPLMLARQRLLAERPPGGRALVASNPGGGLSLLEAFSRNTGLELLNAGYEVTGLYGKSLNARVLRRELPKHDVVLWEGHHNTLIKDWGFLTWDEPLPSSFVFLQSCLALQPEKVHPLLSRGAVAVVGTSTRTYSASGGAFSLAYFDALLYEGQSLGGSLRQAKNFLVAYAALKEKRLGDQASRTGANHRAAWAFSLWGDPTFHLPRPKAATSPLSSVRHEVERNEIVVSLPGDLHEQVTSDRYRVRLPPNGRLAGLLRKTGDEKDAPIVPMVFAEVPLPKVRDGATPRLRSRMPASQWVWLWDARRKTGYLLAMPRSFERGQLRFRVDSSGVRIAERTDGE